MRLIDADLLSNKINSIGYVPVCTDCMTKHNILEIIDEQPTAYDVDKVSEQISNYLDGYSICKDYDKEFFMYLEEFIINIVEGAVKDE